MLVQQLVEGMNAQGWFQGGPIWYCRDFDGLTCTIRDETIYYRYGKHVEGGSDRVLTPRDALQLLAEVADEELQVLQQATADASIACRNAKAKWDEYLDDIASSHYEGFYWEYFRAYCKLQQRVKAQELLTQGLIELGERR